MFDTMILLDDVPAAACAHGHSVRTFQTKDFEEPAMRTYLVHGGRLYVGSPEGRDDPSEDGAAAWRVEGTEAVHERSFTLCAVRPPGSVRVYGHCDRCEPILVRRDRVSLLGDIVVEHAIFVDYVLTFRVGEPVRVARTSGTRDGLKEELRSRGLCVLEDDEPLAVAHRESRRARRGAPLRWV